MRKGKISEIDERAGKGIITDLNLQEIVFFIKDLKMHAMLNLMVTFRIELTNEGLIAVDVDKVK